MFVLFDRNFLIDNGVKIHTGPDDRTVNMRSSLLIPPQDFVQLSPITYLTLTSDRMIIGVLSSDILNQLVNNNNNLFLNVPVTKKTNALGSVIFSSQIGIKIECFNLCSDLNLQNDLPLSYRQYWFINKRFCKSRNIPIYEKNKPRGKNKTLNYATRHEGNAILLREYDQPNDRIILDPLNHKSTYKTRLYIGNIGFIDLIALTARKNYSQEILAERVI